MMLTVCRTEHCHPGTSPRLSCSVPSANDSTHFAADALVSVVLSCDHELHGSRSNRTGKYSVFLDVESLEALESLGNAPALRMINSMANWPTGAHPAAESRTFNDLAGAVTAFLCVSKLPCERFIAYVG